MFLTVLASVQLSQAPEAADEALSPRQQCRLHTCPPDEQQASPSGTLGYELSMFFLSLVPCAGSRRNNSQEDTRGQAHFRGQPHTAKIVDVPAGASSQPPPSLSRETWPVEWEEGSQTAYLR